LASHFKAEPSRYPIFELKGKRALVDGGPSLSTLFGPTKAKGKLQDVIAGALEDVQGRGPRTVGRTVVQDPVRHPGCTASALPVFVVRIH